MMDLPIVLNAVLTKQLRLWQKTNVITSSKRHNFNDFKVCIPRLVIIILGKISGSNYPLRPCQRICLRNHES